MMKQKIYFPRREEFEFLLGKGSDELRELMDRSFQLVKGIYQGLFKDSTNGLTYTYKEIYKGNLKSYKIGERSIPNTPFPTEMYKNLLTIRYGTESAAYQGFNTKHHYIIGQRAMENARRSTIDSLNGKRILGNDVDKERFTDVNLFDFTIDKEQPLKNFIVEKYVVNDRKVDDPRMILEASMSNEKISKHLYGFMKKSYNDLERRWKDWLIHDRISNSIPKFMINDLQERLVETINSGESYSNNDTKTDFRMLMTYGVASKKPLLFKKFLGLKNRDSLNLYLEKVFNSGYEYINEIDTSTKELQKKRGPDKWARREEWKLNYLDMIGKSSSFGRNSFFEEMRKNATGLTTRQRCQIIGKFRIYQETRLKAGELFEKEDCKKWIEMGPWFI